MGYGVQYYLMVILHKQTLIRRNILDKCQYDRILFHIQIFILILTLNGKDSLLWDCFTYNDSFLSISYQDILKLVSEINHNSEAVSINNPLGFPYYVKYVELSLHILINLLYRSLEVCERMFLLAANTKQCKENEPIIQACNVLYRYNLIFKQPCSVWFNQINFTRCFTKWIYLCNQFCRWYFSTA